MIRCKNGTPHMAPIILSLSRSPTSSVDIRTISLYLDARTYFQGPPCSIRLHGVNRKKGVQEICGIYHICSGS